MAAGPPRHRPEAVSQAQTPQHVAGHSL